MTTAKRKRIYKLGRSQYFEPTDPVTVYCCRDGTISYSARGTPSFNGVALPVLSVRSVQEAKDLQVLTCRLQKEAHPFMAPGEGWFTLGSGPFPMGVFSGKVEDLPLVSEHLAKMLKVIRARPVRREG